MVTEIHQSGVAQHAIVDDDQINWDVQSSAGSNTVTEGGRPSTSIQRFENFNLDEAWTSVASPLSYNYYTTHYT